MAQLAVDGHETGAVVQVFQVGYRYKEEVLRPARVSVAS
jgi:molecular chaperone GrpE (heat shock protein)